MRCPRTTHFPNQLANKRRKHRIAGNVLVAVRPLTTSRTASLDQPAHATAPQTGCAPARGLHLIGSIQPVREDSTRSEGVESSRSGVTPHQAQASSRSWPLVTSAVIAGDTLPAFIGTLPSSHALVREPDTRGNGGGFCAMRTPLAVCHRRVGALDGANPPVGSR